jgi:hypothetical protein
VKIDWTRRTRDIARDLGWTQKKVSTVRRRMAPETLAKRGGNFTPVDWSKVDWSKGTVELANELNVSAASVSRWRMILKPSSSKWGMCK